MASPTKKNKKITFKQGLVIYAVCWVLTVLAVWGLRHIFIPKEEMDCYNRIPVFQKAVDQWNAAHPDKPVTEIIDENALTQAGFLPPQTYDHERHYYFVGQTAHGLRVKCNKDEDNPLVLRLAGDSELAVLVFLVYCMYRKYVFFDKSEQISS